MGIIHEGRLLEEIAFDKLRERNRNYLEFQVSDDNKAIMLLESQFGISDYEVHAEGNIRVYSHLGKQGRLNKAFVENGIEVLKDRKSTRLNSSHVSISYAVFCLKKKKKQQNNSTRTV